MWMVRKRRAEGSSLGDLPHVLFSKRCFFLGSLSVTLEGDSYIISFVLRIEQLKLRKSPWRPLLE